MMNRLMENAMNRQIAGIWIVKPRNAANTQERSMTQNSAHSPERNDIPHSLPGSECGFDDGSVRQQQSVREAANDASYAAQPEWREAA